MAVLPRLQRCPIRKLLLAAGVILLSAKYGRLFPLDYSSGLLLASRILIDTPGCRVRLHQRLFPDLPPSTRSSLPVCVGREPPVSFNLDRAFLNYARLDNTYGIHSFRDVSCLYAALVTDSNASASDHRPRPYEKEWCNITTGMKLEAEYFKLRCFHKLDVIYSGLHLVARRRYRSPAAKVAVKPRKKHSVLVVSIGASSRSHFERNFRETDSFLRHSLTAHELLGYSAVGAGSFPSAVALLGGMTAGEAWSRSSGSSYDVLPLLWKDYKKQGHWTLYVEETPSEGAFVDPVDRGFLRKPTDYYPLAMASQMSQPDEAAQSVVPEVGISNEQPSICSGYRLRSKALLDYASELIRAGDGYPFFVFINLKDSSRGGAKARALDRPLKTFLANLERRGVFAETTLILLSDIGKGHWDTGIARDGSDMPLCFVKLPPLLIERYPSVAASMSVNQRRLTTPFDVHATLKALAPLPRELSLEPTQRGRSLLASIPANRSCVDASVPPEYCACVEEPHVSSPLVRPGMLSLAQHALELINNAIGSSPLIKDMCATFVLRRVEHVDDHQSRVKSPTSANTSASDNVLMIVSTVPRAIFSIRARMIPAGAEAEVKSGSSSSINKGHKVEITEVERIDRYADDVSKCVKLVNSKLRRYCYCKDIALSGHME